VQRPVHHSKLCQKIDIELNCDTCNVLDPRESFVNVMIVHVLSVNEWNER